MSDSEEKKSLNNVQTAETPAAEAPKADTTEPKPSTSSDTAGTATVSSVKVESEKKTDTKTASKAKLCFPKVSVPNSPKAQHSSKSV